MRLDYVRLAPGFAREVLEVYENWEGKESVPMKVKELMMVIEIESTSCTIRAAGLAWPQCLSLRNSATPDLVRTGPEQDY